MHKLKIYKEVINDPIHENKRHKVINKELWNLDFY